MRNIVALVRVILCINLIVNSIKCGTTIAYSISKSTFMQPLSSSRPSPIYYRAPAEGRLRHLPARDPGPSLHGDR
ncbi:MAG TPA: hypothetical protein VE035_08160, partial [Puia sp.]|nr:hypothetical protein [Puia sp.]